MPSASLELQDASQKVLHRTSDSLGIGLVNAVHIKPLAEKLLVNRVLLREVINKPLLVSHHFLDIPFRIFGVNLTILLDVAHAAVVRPRII